MCVFSDVGLLCRASIDSLSSDIGSLFRVMRRQRPLQSKRRLLRLSTPPPPHLVHPPPSPKSKRQKNRRRRRKRNVNMMMMGTLLWARLKGRMKPKEKGGKRKRRLRNWRRQLATQQLRQLQNLAARRRKRLLIRTMSDVYFCSVDQRTPAVRSTGIYWPSCGFLGITTHVTLLQVV